MYFLKNELRTFIVWTRRSNALLKNRAVHLSKLKKSSTAIANFTDPTGDIYNAEDGEKKQSYNFV
jgi:hypothetical protein